MIHQSGDRSVVRSLREAAISGAFFLVRRSLAAATLCLLLIQPNAASAQTVSMGISLVNGTNVRQTGVETILAMNAANRDGRVTTATFAWSASPCPLAVEIKFFRPTSLSTDQGPMPPFNFMTERGPFDVTAPLIPGFFEGTLLATQTVKIDPAVDVRAGDLVAITNRTACGSPVYTAWPLASPPPAGSSLRVRGDVTSSVTSGTRDQYIALTASGSGPKLGLLNDRFLVSLTAMDPRTGATADGLPSLLGVGGKAGYFSLPAFTSDTSFPEVTVKMVDARGAPALGGDFWFFHAPLTDVEYTLTVTDQFTGAVKTYSNGSTSPSQLCGGVDTSAFPGLTP